jgi:hypothetical protein
MTHLLLALPAATGPESPSFINGTKIQGILVFVVSLLLFVVAIKMIAKSDRGDVKGAMNSGIVVAIAAVIFALGVTAGWYSLGTGALGSILNLG